MTLPTIAPAGRPTGTTGSLTAVVLAIVAACGPISMIALYVVLGALGDRASSVGGGVLAIVLLFIIELVVAPASWAIALILALVARRRGGISTRRSTVALTVLGITVALALIQVQLYTPFLPH